MNRFFSYRTLSLTLLAFLSAALLLGFATAADAGQILYARNGTATNLGFIGSDNPIRGFAATAPQ